MAVCGGEAHHFLKMGRGQYNRTQPMEKENLPYGYLWWVNEDGYAAMGDGGNIIYVNTKKKLVISIAALFVPKAGDRIELIKKFIEPIL